MESRQGDILASLRGVQDFIAAHADRLGAVATCGAKAKLDAAIGRLSAHAAEQEASRLKSQGATQKLRALRLALMEDHMAPIARIAVAELTLAPELDALRMPSGKLTVEELSAAANGMAAGAEQFAAIFIECGMPADYADRLRAAARAMCDAVDARKQERGQRHGATVGIADAIRKARRLVHVIDAFVRTEIRSDPVLLATWEAVQQVPARRAKSGTVDVAEVVVKVAEDAAPADEAMLSLPAASVVRLLQAPRELLKAG